MVCIDSDILIDFLNNKRYVVERINYYQENRVSLSTTTLNTFEIFRGFMKMKKDINLFYKFLFSLKVLNFDFKSSIKASQIFEILRKDGNLLEIPDILIAAISITNNETLLTNNINHFKRIPGLKIENV